MGRTVNSDQDLQKSNHKSNDSKRSGGRTFHSSQPRTVQISKALSRLLRHQAENSGVPISSDGWVRLDHVLGWKGLKGISGVGIEDVWGVVEENEKKRFAVRLVSDGKEGEGSGEGGGKGKGKDVVESEIGKQPVATVGEILGDHSTADSSIKPQNQVAIETSINTNASTEAQSQEPTISASDSETARAISYYRTTSPKPDASSFLIRATQGHSIKTITSDTNLLTPVTLSTPSTIPTTCVHGTFYGSWNAILRSGGLKRMGRNHVHFAEGPTLGEVGFDERGEKVSDDEGGVAERKEVISGMRRDAQLLIYVDVKKALEEEKNMEWWRSENGVILTEGVENITEANVDADDAAGGQLKESETPVSIHGKSKRAQTAAQGDKMVPMKYWTVVVDVKGGRGAIWRQGEGVVRDLPEELTRMGTPKGRGRGGGRGGFRGRGR